MGNSSLWRVEEDGALYSAKGKGSVVINETIYGLS